MYSQETGICGEASMKQYSLILVGDETTPIRRFQISEVAIKRAACGALFVVVALAIGGWDYRRVRVDNRELADLRIQSVEQSQEMERVRTAISVANQEMQMVGELERKVRIIANLPGSAGVGGAEITELITDGSVDEKIDDDSLQLPAGVPTSTDSINQGASLDTPIPVRAGGGADDSGLTTQKARAMRQLGELAQGLSVGAEMRTNSLNELMIQLDEKRSRLISMPSIWPAKGWLTSRYGPRISPFTGRRQHHAGIDIGAAEGSDIVAPATGRVVFAGKKGPLGNTVVVEHGFGVRTMFGHTKEIFVESGQEVERGELLASVGSTGRSTGPHLHYVVEVKGKSRNPLDYIFD
jgi:murein DD-endopeptidase MepM/ murein hydrolase activator NlpD